MLTAHPRAYERSDPDRMKDVPDDVEVCRAFALDSKRHLSVRGAYLGFTALPDRWVSWTLGAVVSGLGLVRRHRPRVLWSTYPIATAHVAGFFLHRLTGLPWIADFRDSMTEPGYPADPRQFRAYRWIERKAVMHASRCVFTTPGARTMYRERYPDVPSERWVVLPNGYEEALFRDAEADRAPRADDAPITLVHSGVLYPKERDPRPFFGALADLKGAGAIAAGNFRVVLRASGSEEYHARYIRENGIDDLVSLEPAVPYRDALGEMLAADGLLLFQASNCNHQVPAKTYEYLRAKRPVFAMTDPAGDTASVLREAGIDTMARLDSRAEIAAGLEDFLARVREGRAPLADDDEIRRHSRRARTEDFAALLDEVAGPASGRDEVVVPEPVEQTQKALSE